ncbi:MAG TPA: PH domain-containing protein [Pseudonocardiaceae bacterium]|jgi:hypothetical protein|nr:PH domain-containing protein [Pseudonocardiaceae bacterium]
MTTQPQPQWSPRPALIGVGWVAALGTLALTLFSASAETRVITGIATIVLIAIAGYGTLIRPKLRADEQGVVVRLAGGRLRLPWQTVRIKVAETRRLGRTVSLLELDGHDDTGAEQLVLLGWLELGTDPRDVLDVLRALRP